MNEDRRLTFGERAVGLTFNPSGDEDVAKAKQLCADFIDFCNERRDAGSPDVKRMMSVAITDIQSAQMWAVKAITWKE